MFKYMLVMVLDTGLIFGVILTVIFIGLNGFFLSIVGCFAGGVGVGVFFADFAFIIMHDLN